MTSISSVGDMLSPELANSLLRAINRPRADRTMDDAESRAKTPVRSLDAPTSGAGARNNVVVKVGMVGDAQVGKTSLMVKYVEGKFDEDYIHTLGALPRRLLDFQYGRTDSSLRVAWGVKASTLWRRPLRCATQRSRSASGISEVRRDVIEMFTRQENSTDAGCMHRPPRIH
jgi:hypothetical protein